MEIENIYEIICGTLDDLELDEPVKKQVVGLIAWTYGLHANTAYKNLDDKGEFALIFGMVSLIRQLLENNEPASHYALGAIQAWNEWALAQIAK